jgi:hypothetical protein
MPTALQHSAMDRTGTGSTRSIFWQLHVLIIERAIIGSLPSFVHCYNVEVLHAGVAELVDAPDSKSGGRKVVWVRVPPPALLNFLQNVTKYENIEEARL